MQNIRKIWNGNLSWYLKKLILGPLWLFLAQKPWKIFGQKNIQVNYTTLCCCHTKKIRKIPHVDFSKNLKKPFVVWTFVESTFPNLAVLWGMKI